MELRDYQQACIDEIEARPPGRYLVQMATGLGKTVTFANIPRWGECSSCPIGRSWYGNR